MTETNFVKDRTELLADVAEMYFLGGQTQAEIADQVGVTRSMISRMLTEARRKGIVQIRICRPLGFDADLAQALQESFGLVDARVVVAQAGNPGMRLNRLGEAAARVLTGLLAPNHKLGLAWGTTVGAAVNAIQSPEPMPIKIIQLVGAMGARIEDYDGHALVKQLAEKFGGEGFYLHAPFLMESPETVQALSHVASIQEALQQGRLCDLALVGIGSTQEENSSFYRAGYVPIEELWSLQAEGAVGDVCGLHFDIQGQPVGQGFRSRTVTISPEDLKGIPIRIGVAGGLGKVDPILGALRGGYINLLVTDTEAAGAILERA